MGVNVNVGVGENRDSIEGVSGLGKQAVKPSSAKLKTSMTIHNRGLKRFSILFIIVSDLIITSTVSSGRKSKLKVHPEKDVIILKTYE